jgi:hypothetical protein
VENFTKLSSSTPNYTINKTTLRLVLQRNLLNKTFISPFLVGIYMGGPRAGLNLLGAPGSFKIWGPLSKKVDEPKKREKRGK